ncbi:hypothetical protein A9Q81_05750 [Gammaproteobacteria bacterium 42_54_T18]|nr:hypothetical protein A9Q81_05750 [Gammaproteobacteria bacterium 42_54_T18]
MQNDRMTGVRPSSANVDLRCVSSDYLAPILKFLTNCGLDVSDILADTEIGETYPEGILDMLSTGDCEKIIEFAQQRLNQSPYMFGLLVGISMRPTAFGQLGYVGMCSNTFDEALTHSCRFFPLVTPLMQLTYSQGEGRVFLEIIEIEPIGEPIYGFLIGLFLGGLRAMSLFLLGDGLFDFINESSVELKVSIDSYPDLQLLQQGPIDMQFGCDKNCVSFSNKLAFQPLLNGNDNALKSAVISCNRLLEEQRAKQLLRKDRIIEMVSSVIEAHEGGVLDLDGVAKELCLSPRTLSRRLNSAGTRFSKVVMDNRMLKAQRFLQDERLTIKEISYRLGYSEVSNFSIAFKRYAGQSPSEYRLKII